MSNATAPAAVAEGVVISFPSGLPGFPGITKFELAPIPDLVPFHKLRAIDMEGLEFVVVPPGRLFPDYAVRVEGDDALLLELERPDDALILLMVTVPEPPALPSANLLGPIVVNPSAGLAAQVVQHGTDYGVNVALRA